MLLIISPIQLFWVCDFLMLYGSVIDMPANTLVLSGNPPVPLHHSPGILDNASEMHESTTFHAKATFILAPFSESVISVHPKTPLPVGEYRSDRTKQSVCRTTSCLWCIPVNKSLSSPYFTNDLYFVNLTEDNGGSRGGARGTRASPLIWVKKEAMSEGRKAGWVIKIKAGPLLSSKSGPATGR